MKLDICLNAVLTAIEIMRQQRRRVRVVAGVLVSGACILTFCGGAQCQSVSGVVRDVNGRAVHNANVVVERAADSVHLTTGPAGEYSNSVAAGGGRVRISVTGRGFAPGIVEAVVPDRTPACKADVTLFKKGRQTAGSRSGVLACETPQPTPEDQDWSAAVEPFSSAKVEAFLQRYPNGTYATRARQIVEDERIIGQIVASGPGSRFVLPGDSVPPFIAKSVSVNTERGRTIIDAVNHSAQSEFGKTMWSLPTTGVNSVSQLTLSGPFMPCGDLSVFVISGGADNIQGDASDPIRLLYSKQYGVIYIGGKGKIFSIRDHALGDLIFQAPTQ